MELPSDASGVGACGNGLALGTARPRARGCRVVAAPLVRGQIGAVDKWSSESAVTADRVPLPVPILIHHRNFNTIIVTMYPSFFLELNLGWTLINS